MRIGIKMAYLALFRTHCRWLQAGLNWHALCNDVNLLLLTSFWPIVRHSLFSIHIPLSFAWLHYLHKFFFSLWGITQNIVFLIFEELEYFFILKWIFYNWKIWIEMFQYLILKAAQPRELLESEENVLRELVLWYFDQSKMVKYEVFLFIYHLPHKDFL